MAGHAVEHDYHLIPPSPWPFLSGLAALIWGLGMVSFFAGLVPRTGESPMMEFFFAKGLDTIQGKEGASGGWIILVLGVFFAAYVMFGWWRDVARESAAGDHTPVVDIGLRYGMIMFIMQEAMFFVGWFWMFFEIGLFHKMRAGWNQDILENASAYADSMAPGIKAVDPWHLPLMNTLILLLSGCTVTWGHHALIHGDRKGAKWGLGLTVALGFFFIGVQAYEYMELFHGREEGYPWLSTDSFGSAFFLATGFHGLHVLIGAIFLLVCWARVMRGGMKPEKHFGLEAAAWYWHFVDVVWLFLFAFVYVILAP
ncbi:cytochrome c oxidase subunit 3 [Litorimonas sp. RW-G-Af-16]|uniref:cytochrome c oxidase subunit 3 n=1 Tax=Litorimonas sp. RW-G-Af-16 TaxID=3241168 RepID=UPI00390C534A